MFQDWDLRSLRVRVSPKDIKFNLSLLSPESCVGLPEFLKWQVQDGFSFKMNDSLLVLDGPRNPDEPLMQHVHAIFLIKSGVIMTLEFPVSSSRVIKMSPLAVPGRCRAMTSKGLAAFIAKRRLAQAMCRKSAGRICPFCTLCQCSVSQDQ